MMNEHNYDLQRLEILRYEVFGRPHGHSPGHNGLRLVLPQDAADRHALSTLAVTTVDWRGRPNMTKIHATSTAAESATVAPGHIRVRSEDELECELYTFGGKLTAERLAQETILTVDSSAPLLELTSNPESTPDLLMAEAEAVIGRVEVAQKLSFETLMEHLTAVEPLSLYLAILQSMLSQYEEAPAASHLHRDLVALLHSEKRWYADSGEWAVIQPDLATLISKL